MTSMFDKYIIYGMKRKTYKRDGKLSIRAFSIRQKIMEELGDVCSMCGETDVRVLCLHHIIPEWKTHKDLYNDLKLNHAEHNISCLCANCHRLKHLEINQMRKGKPKNWFQSYQSFPEPIGGDWKQKREVPLHDDFE